MRLKLVSFTAAISVVVGLTTATVGLTDAAAWADSTAALPLSHYSHMVVDAAHQRIFFSQGDGSTGILVTDLSGAPITTIADELGATGLAFSADGGTLYAALADGDAIAAIDTATAAHSAYDHVKVAESLSGYYTSTTYDGTVYRVYHHTVKPQVGVAVTPNKAGQCQRLQAQQYYSGAWHTLTTSPCYTLNSSSLATAKLSLTNAVGKKFSVCSEYVHSSVDNTNLSTWSGWLYLTVRT